MNDKLKILADSWDENAKKLRSSHPLKSPTSLPKMAGITPQTSRFLKAKGLFYLIWNDKHKIFLRYFFKHPLRYAFSLIKSYQKPQSFIRNKDLFFYGLKNETEFKTLASSKNTTVLIGFSYCHKPFECPSGRFSDQCQNSASNPVCGQCFIGKCSTLASHTNAKILYIPTIHYIGEKIFEQTHLHPDRNIVFLITACELSLTLFGDWGNMIKARGIGIRLDGRICNTMKAFALSEEGIKPGLTVVLDETQKQILKLIESLQGCNDSTCEKV